MMTSLVKLFENTEESTHSSVPFKWRTLEYLSWLYHLWQQNIRFSVLGDFNHNI